MDYAFLDLLNSDWHDWKGSGKSEDRLEDAQWLDWFMQKWNLRVPPCEYEALKRSFGELRSTIKSALAALKSGGAPAGDFDRLDALLRDAAFHMRIITGGASAEAGKGLPEPLMNIRLEAEPERRDLRWVLAAVAESFVRALALHGPARLKVCANPDCGWFFLDESRARSRAWCDSKVCGNLAKVRRFRQKHRPVQR